MTNFAEGIKLTGLLLWLMLGAWLSPASAVNTPPADEAWALGYLDSVLPEMLTRSQACTVPAAPRFFEALGGDYTLDLGGGRAEIIGRGSWKAGPVITEGRSWIAYPAGSSVCGWMTKITIHHTHMLYTMLLLQRSHQNLDDPKADIAYHFLIDNDGKIYEGRPLGYIGSHSERDNTSNVGIVLNGDFVDRAPAPIQFAALRRLLAALRCPCSPLDSIWTHQQRQGLNFPGDPAHATACPGQYLASKVYGLATEFGIGPMTRAVE